MASCSSNVQCSRACLVIEQSVTAMLEEGVEHLGLTLPRSPHERGAALCVTAVGVTPQHQETHTALVVPLGLQGHRMHGERKMDHSAAGRLSEQVPLAFLL